MPEQVDRMNQPEDGFGGDVYSVDDSTETGDTYGNLSVMNPLGEAWSLGKVQVNLFGESTFRPWLSDSIPNIRVDTDEFQSDLELGGFEHLRFSNCQVGSIFAEAVALGIYNALGFPAPRTEYAFVGGSPWVKQSDFDPVLGGRVLQERFLSKAIPSTSAAGAKTSGRAPVSM